MPGVPTYRGCNACRKQKKKCDMATPACSRCARLKIPCIGCGQLRYKFRDQSNLVKSSNEAPRKAAPSPNRGVVSNRATARTGAFISLLEISDPKYDLVCYGGWFKELPKRLGKNEALDAAVEAMASFYPYLHTQETPTDSVVKYVNALETLRTCLSNPKKAAMMETLCAIYILMICQGWAGRHGDSQMSHGEGLAHLLDQVTVRGNLDNFETPIRDTLCIPVIMEGIYNPRIRFPSWFSTILEEKIMPSSLLQESCGNMTKLAWRSLLKVPDLVREPRKTLPEMAELYQKMRLEIPHLRQYMEQNDELITRESEGDASSQETGRRRIHCQMMWGLSLVSAMILNGYLRALGVDDGNMVKEAESLANDAILLGHNAAQYRPLGASFVPNCLIPGWAITEDLDIKKRVAKTLEMYQDEQMPVVSKSWYIIAVWIKGELELARSGQPPSGLENYHLRRWGTIVLDENGDAMVDGFPRKWFTSEGL